MNEQTVSLQATIAESLDRIERSLAEFEIQPTIEQLGRVVFVGAGVARVLGLPEVKSEELITLAGRVPGIAFDLGPDVLGVILLDKAQTIEVGSRAVGTGRVVDVPVGDQLLGRTVDAVGRPRDDQGAIETSERWPIEREAPEMIDRAPVKVPLQTGWKVIDALIPIGRGQRELILGDRQTGKTAIALDTVINQRDSDVRCIYCSIGQKSSSVAELVASLEEHGARDSTTVVVASGDDPPGMLFVAPFAAMTMAEYFRDQGQDALVVFDDLTQHARAYRQLSLLLRRPPGREAYPGDIFYLHSRLLERSTQLKKDRGGGSLTALPIAETQAQNLSAYIPTNLISITDGQIYVSPQLFRKGFLPAVDVGRSVSRVGGKTQLPAYRDIAGDLKLSYSQFEELESFSRFSTRLDEETRKILDRGRRVRESLKQKRYDPLTVIEQLAALVTVNEGLYDSVAVSHITDVEEDIRALAREQLDEQEKQISDKKELTDDQRQETIDKLTSVIKKQAEQENDHADS